MRPKSIKTKPSKPHPDFPLFSHESGRWAKKVRGKMFYFGPWAKPQAALEKWLREKDYLLAGRVPPAEHDPDALTVEKLVNLYCASIDRMVKTGERSQRTLDDYIDIGKQICEHFGRHIVVESLTPHDFASFREKLADGRALKTIESRIAYARAIFSYAQKNGFLERSLTKIWGTEFNKPSKTAITKESAGTVRMFEASEVRQLIKTAEDQVRAMILLGINGAIGPTDIALIRFDSIEGEWLTLPRSKTGKPRRVPLWPETIKAIEAAKRHRPKPKAEADGELLFITKYGASWLPTRKRFPLSAEFTKIRKKCDITARGKTFYGLRHTFQTIGDETRDFVAVSSIMGHVDQSISSHYRDKIGDDRLQAVTDHVHQWLFSEPKGTKKAAKRVSKGGAK